MELDSNLFLRSAKVLQAEGIRNSCSLILVILVLPHAVGL